MKMSKRRKTTPETSDASGSSSALIPNANSTVIANSSPTLVQNSDEFIEESLKKALLDWLKEQPLYQSNAAKEKETQENVVKDLAEGLISVIKQTPKSDNMDNILLEEIKTHVQNFPVDPKQKSIQTFMNELPTQILEHLKSLQLFQDILLRHDRPKNVKKKAAVVLLEDITNWVENLPIETDSPEEAENVREQLKSKFIHKVGELNMNSEIFNDDYIYDDILGDEVENLLADISGENIKNDLPAIKKALLAIVKKARKKIRDENAGQIYKQQLCDTISNTLPSFELSIEGKASFEVLKDDVADAFISMHYVGDDEEEAIRLRQKINDEINTFCSNYLKRCPASPIDTTKLNEALYKALYAIAEPENESFTDDVELIKIKSEINEWAKDLPLKGNTGQEKLHTNKMILVLAKKIHEIENEKELISAKEYEERMKKETTKFLNKLPLATENDDDLNEFVKIVVKRLKDTEEIRKLNASTKLSDQLFVKRPSKAKLRITFNDASVSPCPVDTCSQTSSSYNRLRSSPCLVQNSSSVQNPCKRMQAVISQTDVMPNVANNECHWDPINKSSMQPRRVLCPCPTPSRPPYVVMPQPLSPITTREDESCVQPPRVSCPGTTASRPSYLGMSPQPQLQSSVSQQENECTSVSLKSCLTTRPFPLQPFENKFNRPCDPDLCKCAHYQIQSPTQCSPSEYNYDDTDYTIPETSPPCRRESQAESIQAERQYSNQSLGLHENNSFQRRNQQSSPYQLQRRNSPCSPPPCPYHLSTNSVPERPEPRPLRNQYPRQLCPTPHEVPGQESQCIPYTPCPGSSPITNRRSHQGSPPMSSCPFMTSSPPHFSQG